MVDANTQQAMPDEKAQRSAAPLDAKTADLLTRMYLARRLDYQISFYQSRIREFDKNADMMFRWGAAVMALSSLIAAINLGAEGGIAPFLRLLTALLPTLAALIASFQQLYQWERQAGIYRDSILGLEEARLIVPDLDELTPERSLDVYDALIERAEQVFQAEVNQWGQITRGEKKEGSEDDMMRAFAEKFNLDVFKKDGTLDPDKMGHLRGILGASQGPVGTRIQVETPYYTPTGSLPAGVPQPFDAEPLPMDTADPTAEPPPTDEMMAANTQFAEPTAPEIITEADDETEVEIIPEDDRPYAQTTPPSEPDYLNTEAMETDKADFVEPGTTDDGSPASEDLDEKPVSDEDGTIFNG
jgi:hypothetical protein